MQSINDHSTFTIWRSENVYVLNSSTCRSIESNRSNMDEMAWLRSDLVRLRLDDCRCLVSIGKPVIRIVFAHGCERLEPLNHIEQWHNIVCKLNGPQTRTPELNALRAVVNIYRNCCFSHRIHSVPLSSLCRCSGHKWSLLYSIFIFLVSFDE